jgi:hypothetical protein
LKGLPYVLEKAEANIDIWSFGLLLYHLCTGKPFLPVNRDDDLADVGSV